MGGNKEEMVSGGPRVHRYSRRGANQCLPPGACLIKIGVVVAEKEKNIIGFLKFLPGLNFLAHKKTYCCFEAGGQHFRFPKESGQLMNGGSPTSYSWKLTGCWEEKKARRNLETMRK